MAKMRTYLKETAPFYSWLKLPRVRVCVVCGLPQHRHRHYPRVHTHRPKHNSKIHLILLKY